MFFSDQAKADLEEIGDYIAKRSPLRALSFIIELETKAMEIGEMPLAFPLVPHYEHHDIRRRVHGNYLIFYRVGLDHVAIVHILHGARDYEPLLFPEG